MEIIEVNIEELKPNPKNPRKISNAKRNELIRRIKEFGFADPIIVNKNKERYNIIIGGHQRVEAAKRMGYKTVPCVYMDLTEEKEGLLNIRLNNPDGDWDQEKLYQMIKEFSEREMDITLTGFEEPFIDELLQAHAESERDSMIDIAPAIPDNPRSKRGDLWQLNNHRVYCGDSTDETEVSKLMQGKIADMVWIDPPYGVSYKGTNNPNGKDWGVMQNDELRGNDLFKFLEAIYKNLFRNTKSNAALYSCYASINHMIFETALGAAGYKIKQQLIWEKGHILGHSDYHYSHEPILYCRKEANTEWFGDRTHKTVVMQNTIEQLDKLTKEQLIEIISKIREYSDMIHMSKDPVMEYQHATQKPVELIKTMIKNNSRPKEIVLDLCLGSGSTLMACETSGRICYGQEIEPKYFDVIIRRYAKYKNKTENIFKIEGEKKIQYETVFGEL